MVSGDLPTTAMRKTMHHICWTVILAAGVWAMPAWAAKQAEQQAILQTREAVWRAWFANDKRTLERLVPANVIAISSGEEKWKNQADIFWTAADFQANGGKLIRLEFPRTEIQRYGQTAFVYSEYVLETEVAGKRSIESGRVTEVFVLNQGKWMNSGWHTDSRR
jgi:Domain of unknown function (DUF4440)